MRKSKFSEEQIIRCVKQEAGMAVAEISRKGGFSDPRLYKWRAKVGGMKASDARRLRKLEGQVLRYTFRRRPARRPSGRKREQQRC